MNVRVPSLRIPARIGLPGRRLVIPLVLILLLLLFIQIVRAVNAANRLEEDWQAAQGILQSDSLSMPAPDQFTQLDTLLGQTESDVHELRSSIGPLIYLAPLFSWAPRYGGDLSNAPALLELADQGLAGSRATFTLGQTLQADLTQNGANKPKGQLLVQTIQAHAADLLEAQRTLDAATRARASLNPALLSPTFQRVVARFDRLLPQWQVALDGLSLAPVLFGADRPRTYLVLLQNSDELRPSGGLISGVARLQVDRGDYKLVDFKDSYAVDDLTKTHPPPPLPLTRYMNAGIWVLRDTNWSPDFPTAAQAAEQLYQLDQGVAVDGVIALNMNLLPRVMSALGPITLTDYNETVDASNVMGKLQEYWASPQGVGQTGDWWYHRKDFPGKLLAAVMARIQAGSLDSAQLSRVLLDSFQTKNILVYINGVTPAAGRVGILNGAVSRARGDAFMVVDSNVGFNKVDATMQRNVDYVVRVDATGAATATLTINFANASPASDAFCVHLARYFPTYHEMQQGCYWDYQRVVVAPQAQFMRIRGVLEGGAEDPLQNRAVLDGYFLMAGGEKRQVIYEYTMPRVTDENGAYRLLIEKQPGMAPLPVKLTLQLPAEWKSLSAWPPPASSDGQTLHYDLTLDRDLEVVVQPQGNNLLAPGLALGGVALIGAAGLGWWTLARRKRAAVAMASQAQQSL
ncbi:MAG: DUF4012 domain-containing protein [Anaerolineae bacterium]